MKKNKIADEIKQKWNDEIKKIKKTGTKEQIEEIIKLAEKYSAVNLSPESLKGLFMVNK